MLVACGSNMITGAECCCCCQCCLLLLFLLDAGVCIISFCVMRDAAPACFQKQAQHIFNVFGSFTNCPCNNDGSRIVMTAAYLKFPLSIFLHLSGVKTG